MKRYYLSKIVGAGTEFDPYRPKVAEHNVSWAGNIPSNPDGTPKASEVLVLVNARNHAVLRDDPDIEPLPDFPLDGKVNAIENQTLSRMEQALDRAGFDTAALRKSDGYREYLQSVGRQHEPNFRIDNFDVKE